MFLDTDFEKELSIEPILNSSTIPVNNYNYSCQISDLDEMLAPPPKLQGSEEYIYRRHCKGNGATFTSGLHASNAI